MKAKTRQALMLIISLIVILPCVFSTVLAAATTVTPIEGCVTVTDSMGTGTLNSGTITITASGYWSSKTNTVTITNTSASKARISFDYHATGSIDSFSESASLGTKELTLDAEGTYELTISNTSQMFSKTTATLTLSNFKYSAISDNVTIATNYDSSFGSVTAAGAEVANGGSITIPSDGIALIATPVNNAEFVGWINMTDNTMLSTSASFVLQPIAGLTSVQAIFVPQTSTTTWFLAGGDKIYDDFSVATEYASSHTSNKTVVLLRSGTMATGTHNIPDGVSFLIPYSKSDYTIDNSTYTDDSGSLASTLEHANVAITGDDTDDGNTTNQSVTGVMEPYTSVTYTLTIPSGTTVNVNNGGKLVIGGTLVAGTYTTTGVCGATAGAHANIQLEGTINVNTSGILSCCGYILGGGTLNVLSGGTVYQPYAMLDHKDGHYLYGAKQENYFPFNRHTLMNIRSRMVLNAGADMYGYATFFTKEQLSGRLPKRYNVTSIHVVGSGSETALFLLDTEAETTMTMTYDANKTLSVSSSNDNNTKGYYSKVGQTKIELDGNASMGYITLSITVMTDEYNMSTEKNAFPLSYNYNVVQKSGTFYANYDMALLPGSSFTVENGAFLTIASGVNFTIYDGLRDYAQRSESVNIDTNGSGTWPRYHYPSSADLVKGGFNSTANLIINGTMNVNGNLGGYVQTNGTTGRIVMGANAGNTVTTVFGVKNKTVEINVIIAKFTIAGSSGKTTRTLTAKAFAMADSTSPITLEANKTYVTIGTDTNTINNYTYAVYTSHDSDTTTLETKNDLNATITGTWCVEGHNYESVVTEPTCTEKGYTTHTCSICGDNYQDTEVPATGHTDTEDNNLECDGCDMLLTKLAAIEASADAETELRLKFLVHENLLAEGKDLTANISFDTATRDEDEVTTVQLSKLTQDEKGRYVLTQDVASGEMMRYMTVSFTDQDGKAIYIVDYTDNSVSESVQRNVVDYARLALEKSTDSNQKALVAALITYGGYAQRQFGIDTDNLASAILNDYPDLKQDISSVTADTIASSATSSGTITGIASDKTNTFLEAAIYMRSYFTLADGASIDDYTFTLTYTVDHNERTSALTPTLESSTNRYYVDILNIPAAYLDYPYTITIMHGLESYKETFSVLDYLKAILNSAEASEAQKNLAKAMYLYNQAANNYFGK